MNIYETRRVKLKCLVLGAAGAGKTSILRRYFYHTFESGIRCPTKGSDFYVETLKEPVVIEENDNDEEDDEDNNNNNKEIDLQLHLQMWDTPGRERFYLKKQPQYTASLSDSFLDKADACLLVYDMTSSTSFTQLLRWYADLMDRHTGGHQFPILIVGNKLDLYQATQQRASTLVHPRRVPQRDVLGLHGKAFRGKDFQYEYRVSPIKSKKSSSSSSSSNDNIHATTPQRNHQQHRQRRSQKRVAQEVSSFLANRENWTKDNSYLDSLLNSEDASSPDRDMVLLWCLRNGLLHLEVSAATGQGVQDAIRTLARLALEHALEREYRQQQQQQADEQAQDVAAAAATATDTSLVADASAALDVHRPMDLQERYRPKDAACGCLRIRPPWCCKRK